MLKAKLVIIGGDAKAGEISLELPTTIGRGKEADLTIPHALVSRAHSKLFERDGQLWVEDLGSLNGTFVDKNRIESEQLLEPNHLLTLGNITFRAVYQIDESGRKTLPTTKLPSSFETVSINPMAVQQTVSRPKVLSDVDAIAADADTNFAETIADPAPVYEAPATYRSAISEIDSFDPDEIGSLSNISDIINSDEMAAQGNHPTNQPHLKPVASTQQPKRKHSPKPKKSPVIPTAAEEVAIDLGIADQAPIAAISSVDIDLPDAQAAPASFIGKIQTGDDSSPSIIDDFQIKLDSDHEPEADVDVSRLDSFLKKLPK